jgi:hypothetical protein
MRFRDALISIASIGILIALLAISDERVREQLTRVTPDAVSQQFAHERGALRTASLDAHDVMIDSGPLAVLVLAGTILFVCMLRT